MNWKSLDSLKKTIPSSFPKKSLLLTLFAGICLSSIALVSVKQHPGQSFFQNQLDPLPKSKAFRQAINKAAEAAQLTQSAKTSQEWNDVAVLWQEAIDLMEAVPSSNSQHEQAKKKASEYRFNLEYAHGNALEKSPVSNNPNDFWSIGSRLEDVVRIQGKPLKIRRYDSLCKQVAYYKDSQVEIKQGVVTDYKNFDNNLKVATNESASIQPQTNSDFWSLGSSKEEVLRLQGTPTQVVKYESLAKEIVYYNNSRIEFNQEQVTAYSNLDDNLKVAIETVPEQQLEGDLKTNLQDDNETLSEKQDTSWNLGSPREEVLKLQGTPTQFMRYDSSCKEVIYYKGSSIELKNGIVNGYKNVDNNLKIPRETQKP